MPERSIFSRSKTRKIRNSAFTLVEVLISFVLIGIGIFFCTKVFVTSKYFMKETENKSRAMEIADLHMSEYLTWSYDGLFKLAPEGIKDKTTVASGTAGINNFFTWQVNVSDKSIPKVGATYGIPYEEIEVICSYKEQNVNGLTVPKYIRLVNMVPYPYMHLFSQAGVPTGGAKVNYYADACPGNICPANTAASIVNTNHSGESRVIEMDFETKVKSNLQIFYNISTNIENSTGIKETDLIFSKCFIIDRSTGLATGYEIQTGTPIISQPTISNVVIIQGLAKGQYTLRVVWFKDYDTGVVTAKRVNAVIFQVEEEN